MRTIYAILVVLISMSPCAAQDPCDSPTCQRNRAEQLRKELDLLNCEFHEDSVERYACLMRLTPVSGACTSKPTPPDQIKCLEDLVDGLMRAIPAIVADQIRRELTPKIHK